MEYAKKERLVPYDMATSGFEMVYTGETSSKADDSTDENGNVIEKWSIWTWRHDATEWNDEIQCINKMQEALGPLDDNTRQIRAHIGSLVLCDSGIPVTIDELLIAIGLGRLDELSFRNGCWFCGMWWNTRGTQPRQVESMRTAYAILIGYLAGKPKENFIEQFPYAADFINRTYEWLGPVSELTELQKLMMERVLLPFEFFTKASHAMPPSTWTAKAEHLCEVVMKDCFEEGGRGAQLDAKIAQLAGLPKIHPYYKGDLDFIEDEQKRVLYKLCGYIAHGLHT
ncbi:MAG: hypothetical protein ACE5HW_05930, partial [Candidatus Methanofastidiosia archaeon]